MVHIHYQINCQEQSPKNKTHQKLREKAALPISSNKFLHLSWFDTSAPLNVPSGLVDYELFFQMTAIIVFCTRESLTTKLKI